MTNTPQVDAVVETQANDAAPKKKKKRGPGRPKGTQVTSPVVDNPVPTQNDRISELEGQIKLLTGALLEARAPVGDPEDDATIGVMKTGGGNLSMYLTDAYGREKHFFWEHDGQILYMTPAQYEEIFTLPGGQKFFDKHWLQLETEDLVLYMDTDKFINSLEYEEINNHIKGIEEKATIQRMLVYLESVRVITEDEEGNPFTDAEGLPTAKVIEWTPKERMVAQACVDRLYELTGVRYSLADG